MDNTSPLCQPIEAIFHFRGNCAKGKKTSARVQPQVLCILCSPCALLESLNMLASFGDASPHLVAFLHKSQCQAEEAIGYGGLCANEGSPWTFKICWGRKHQLAWLVCFYNLLLSLCHAHKMAIIYIYIYIIYTPMIAILTSKMIYILI